MQQNINKVNDQQPILSDGDPKTGQLKAIFYLLQTHLEEYSKEVDRSYNLLKIGKKTDFTKKIEQMLEDPISDLAETSTNFDDKIKNIIDLFVKSFFLFRRDLISSAYRSKTCLNDLHYSIVLKDDTVENRNKMFDFFLKYDTFDFSSRYQIYFQFVPQELLKEIRVSEEIKLDEPYEKKP